MPGLHRTLIAATTMLGWIMPLNPTQAENCWMIGCTNRIGYIFVPTQLFPSDGHVHYRLDGKECSYPTNDHPLGKDRLPDVNSIVPISVDRTLLLTQEAIHAHLGSFQAVTVERNDDGSDCRAVWREPVDVPGDALKAGAKVKILGFRTFVNVRTASGPMGDATYHEQILFALVLVLTDS
jgi:hypothetical protein